MNTVNAGSPNDSDPEGRSGVPWVALGLGILALAVVVLIGPRLVGILFAIMAPPEPPVPNDARLLAYSRQVYGVDTWNYDTGQDICQLVDFYQQHDGQCPVIPLRCLSGESDANILRLSKDYVAVCQGEAEFSIFAMRWRFAVPVRTAPAQRLRFDLTRQISWTGDLPPAGEIP